jgi:thiosulfate/3-mercaptopyruvate sulfurtransferase
MYTTLIEPAELAAPLSRHASGDSDWVVLDCRFELARPDWGVSAYAAGHIPGAQYAHLDRDLAGPITPTSGRHPLPGIEQLAETFGRWGIDDKTQVVAYDQGNGAFAARLWWLLRWMGHRNVAVLNGGFAAWQQSGLPTGAPQPGAPQPEARQPETIAATHAPRVFTPRPEPSPVVSTVELERRVAAGEFASSVSVLVDARAADRFAGENETIDPVGGHIPGARNHPFSRNLDSRGRFLPAAELQERWRVTLADAAPAQTIAMCGSGVTACHNLLALEVAGLEGARLYAGSWSEWIRDRSRPVTR